MSKKVLITGCSGQDGSYMADYLLKNTDYTIYGMIRRTSKPDYSNLTEALKNPRFQLVVGDLSDSQSIDNLVKQILPDYFINLAAQSFVGSSWQIPEQTFDIDAVGVIRCLEAIRKHCKNCRFYNAGSSEEFGDVVTVPQTMAHPARARSPYGAAKVAARQIVKVYRESYGLYAIQGLLFNHESERRGEEFVTRKITLGVARIIHSAKAQKAFEPIELGNLDSKRDWSHAEDFVDGIWRMLNLDTFSTVRVKQGENDVIPFKEYLLSSNETHSIREFIEIAFKLVGLNGVWENPTGKPEGEEFVVFNEDKSQRVVLVRVNPTFYRPSEVSLLHGDSTEVRLELGWKPANTFVDLVKRMVENDLKTYKL